VVKYGYGRRRVLAVSKCKTETRKIDTVQHLLISGTKVNIQTSHHDVSSVAGRRTLNKQKQLRVLSSGT
jgi:hypothetical protein